MRCEPTGSASRDILASWPRTILLFCLPVAAIVLTASSGTSEALRTAVWMTACLTIGASCLVNAARCGRVHCYFTGPFFLVMGLVTLLYGVGVLPLGQHGWSAISVALLAGGIVFGCLPELFLGKYRASR